MASPNSVYGKTAALPEPERSVWALFHSLAVEPETQREILGLEAPAYAAALAKARRALAPAASFPESALLQIHRPWGEESRKVGKAVQAAEKKPELQAQLAAQTAFDRQWHGEIEKITAPEGFHLPELATPPTLSFRAILRQPAVLAIGFALLVVLSVCILGALHRLDDFPGKENVVELIEQVDQMSGKDLEQIKPTEAGKLGDGFMLKGLDGYAVPEELTKEKAVGWRTFKFQGVPIAMVALNRHNALLLVFRAADLHVVLNSPEWQIFQQDNWAVAARGDGENCFVVAFLGDTDDMVKYLHKAGAERE